jgi:hypothetical protein
MSQVRLKAIEHPLCAEAYDKLGDFHDGLRDDRQTAMRFYRQAALLRGTPICE